MSEMIDREMLSAILKALEALGAEVKAIRDDTVHIRKDLSEHRKETANIFNKVERRFRFIESDYEQLNERVDKLELSDASQ